MEQNKTMVAFDCSNSSIRTVLGRYDGTRIEMQEVAREANGPIRVQGYDYWDILSIFRAMLDGLARVLKLVPRIDSIGICTWGVDFAFLNQDGLLMGNPLAYRNQLGGEILDSLSAETRARLFNQTGILCDKINSIFLLKALGKRLPYLQDDGLKFLMVPDLLNYMLTGVIQNEPSELSTSQLMDVRTCRLSRETCRFAGFQKTWKAPLGEHGQLVGMLSRDIRDRLEINDDIPVVCVPSHDTAAAVLAVPTQEKDFAFISSGTWSILGTELSAPILTQEVERQGFSNELGAFGRTILLKNTSGMFILQRLREEFDNTLSWDQVVERGSGAEDGPLFNVNDPRLFHPDNMREALWDLLRDTGQTLPGQFDFDTAVNSFHLSMACSYRDSMEKLEHVTEKTFQEITILGGGGRNIRLCQLTADLMGKRVVTGSSESTSLGNLLTQVRWFEPERTVSQLRAIAAESIKPVTFLPQRSREHLWERYQKIIERRD